MSDTTKIIYNGIPVGEGNRLPISVTGDIGPINSIQFDTTPTGTTPTEGLAYWNSDDGTLNLGMPGGNVNLQIGQEQLIRAKATENILNGQLVYISGASGQKPEATLTNNLDESNAEKVIAMATENVTSGQQGYFTTFGIVRDVNTDPATYTDGDTLYLGSTDGSYTNAEPSNPSACVRVGYVIYAHASEGKILVKIDPHEIHRDRLITKEPTGFFDNSNCAVSYDSTTRKITLSGTVEAYWRGARVTALTAGWVSDAHTATTGSWFLSYDGTNFTWSQTVWAFDALQIAYVYYGTSDKFAIKEVHGLMQWQTHEELHRQIGTYRESGGDLGSYVVDSTTAGDRRPTISACVIHDEDIEHTLATVTNDTYTIHALSGAGATSVFTVDAGDIVLLSGANPYYNQYTGGAWQQTLVSNNNYFAMWLVAVPAANDATSQKYRFLWLQGQTTSLIQSTIENLTPANLTLGGFTGIFPEYTFICKVVLQYTAANWVIKSVTNITGNRSSTVSTGGGYLSSVSVNTTNLSGNGTASNPINTIQNIDTTATPTFAQETLTQAGTVKTTTDFLTITNTGNAADMDGTGSAIKFNQYYYDATTPATEDSGKIEVTADNDWTSTASTRDSSIYFSVSNDGTLSRTHRFMTTGGFLFGNLNYTGARATLGYSIIEPLAGFMYPVGLVSGGSGANWYAPYFGFGRHRADTIGGTTIVQNNDYLGGLTWNGWDGTNPIPAAYILGFCDGTPGSNDMPGRLEFSTTADGASTPTVRMRIRQNGQRDYETYTIKRTIFKDSIADNTATTVATITTTNESGSTDGGSYSVFIKANIEHPSNTSGANPISTKAWMGSFSRAVISDASVGVNSAVDVILSGSSAATSSTSRDIGTITVTVVEVDEYINAIKFQVDTTGTNATTCSVRAEIEVIYNGFASAPIISNG